ncbi:glycosyltransferase [Gluconobacter morbifer]|uniref:Glycosyltransferase n=1 Tax=Gluconobacter morbifer G707 TaxID=1088869 RepID=G6XKA5_9PROT|nr:glycosyltransferase [Gluconobacter morbifer]EHH67701.1 glycosyltransferase [Gluconobacter morbifer G707]
MPLPPSGASMRHSFLNGEAGSHLKRGSDTIAILLSLHNGAAYLPAQLESILAQTHEDWLLYWRDDASSDDSPILMREFAARAGQERFIEITSHPGRLGVAASYAYLLNAIPTASHVAFADQDDVWHPRKLAWAMESIAPIPAHVAALYCARQYLTDENLNIIGQSSPLRRSPGFPNALTQNIATGHTILFNAATHHLLQNHAPPPSVLHDWWAYLLTSGSGGRIVFDDRCVSHYRQHGRNTIGAQTSLLHRGYAALRRGPNVFMSIFEGNVRYLLEWSEILSPEALRLLEALARAKSFSARLHILKQYPDLKRQTWCETAVFQVWYLLRTLRS